MDELIYMFSHSGLKELFSDDDQAYDRARQLMRSARVLF